MSDRVAHVEKTAARSTSGIQVFIISILLMCWDNLLFDFSMKQFLNSAFCSTICQCDEALHCNPVFVSCMSETDRPNVKLY